MRELFAAFWMVVAAIFSPPAAAQTQSVYAITDVTVVPMDRERLIPGQTVIVRNGRIERIGPAGSISVPAGAVRVEGRGRYLMPGLAEMHAHVPPNPADVQWTEDVLFLYAANGVTFARSMLGAPHHLELRAKAERGDIVSPRIYTSGPSLNGNSVSSPEAGARMVAEQKVAGYDTMKIHPGLDRAEYDAIVAAARQHKISFGGHVPEAVGLARALEAGQATVDHLDGYLALMLRDGESIGDQGFFGADLVDKVDERKIADLARRTRAAGVWNVPTDSLVHHVFLPTPSAAEMEAREELKYVPRAMLAQWKQARAGIQSDPAYDGAKARRYAALRGKLIKALHDEGAGLLLGSDAPQWFNVPGFSLHRELAYLVGTGLTPYQALTTGTRNVAQFLGTPDAFGTVEEGRRADLILLEANPLADVANVQRRVGVMLNGRWLPEAELQAGLAKIADRYKQ
ncbi:MAG TPA: amidohydrolase family protein [Allosphingosinicella sp.]|uniref:amidohydrolase family protein n=1 Tax=Allosphingosinicella sp. TaxID=2823234 RepID=UPI002ED996E2